MTHNITATSPKDEVITAAVEAVDYYKDYSIQLEQQQRTLFGACFLLSLGWIF